MPENGNGSKYPTFQLLLGISVSIILIIAGASLSETRTDIRDAKRATSEVCDRVTVLETASRLQFDSIKQWREEMKIGMEKISAALEKHERSQGVVKRWQDFPESRK